MSGVVVPFDRGRLRDEIRRAMSDPWRVCEVLGISEGAKRQSGGLSVRCPAHDERDPSCSITEGPAGGLRVRCFACDFTGDEITLVAQVERLDVRREYLQVLERAADRFGIDRQALAATQHRPAAREERRQVSLDLETLWSKLPRIDAEAWEYLRGRNLEDAADLCRGLADLTNAKPAGEEGHTETPKMCGGAAKCPACRWEYAASGYALALPLRDPAGILVAIQVRNIRAEKGGERDNRFLAIGPTSAGVFGDPRLLSQASTVVLAEGLTDTLAATIAFADGGAQVIGVAGVNAAEGLARLPLRGKRVLVASDPDPAGDLFADGRSAAEAAIESSRTGKLVKAVTGWMERLSSMGASPVRARPPDGMDLASMWASGADVARFCRQALVAQAGFLSGADRLGGEREERLAIGPRSLKFGVVFLDRTLGGIFPSDVILLGGGSGFGKTELARLIAQTNVDAGRRVHYFALEAEPREIERRAKYVRVAQLVIANCDERRYRDRLNFLDWYAGRLDDLTGPFEDEADADIAATHKNFFTHYPDGNFSIGDFERAFLAVADDTDLVVLDHFHFLDFGDNENREAKAAIKKIRQLSLETRKPILVVAHIRKADRGARKQRLIPVLDDFHGSSDVVKMATKAVLLAPAYDRANRAPHLWNTYLSAGKCRVEGSRARYAACVEFDARRRVYDDEFTLGVVSSGGDKFTQLDSGSWPAWAKWHAPVREYAVDGRFGSDP